MAESSGLLPANSSEAGCGNPTGFCMLIPEMRVQLTTVPEVVSWQGSLSVSRTGGLGELPLFSLYWGLEFGLAEAGLTCPIPLLPASTTGVGHTAWLVPFFKY